MLGTTNDVNLNLTQFTPATFNTVALLISTKVAPTEDDNMTAILTMEYGAVCMYGLL